MRGVANLGAQYNSIPRHCFEAAYVAGRATKLEMHVVSQFWLYKPLYWVQGWVVQVLG